MELKNKVALVTGAASGIGLAIIQELLVNEVKGIVLVDYNSTSGKKVLDDLTTKYGSDKFAFVHADVCNEEQYEKAFKTAITKFGQLDIVVNNAGIANDIEYEKTIEINLTSVVRGTLLGLKYLGKNALGHGGVILNTASITAIELSHAIPVYGATKAGVVNLTRGFNHSCYYENTGVRVLAILPGFTDTNILNNIKTFAPDDVIPNIIKQRKVQPVSAVGKGALYAIKNCEAGCTWVIDDSKLFLLPPLEPVNYGTLIIDDLEKM